MSIDPTSQVVPDRKSRPAATVILTRESGLVDCGFEVLMLQRSTVGAFAGMWVFPGGRIDDADAGEDDLSKARSAAVREAAEEVSAAIEHSSLSVWSHWTPPLNAPARFTTWFFVAPWAGKQVVVDNYEIVDHRWMAPDHALTSGIPMAPPTIVTLHELLEAGGHDAIHRGRVEPPAYVTRPAVAADGSSIFLWSGDAGYETGNPDLPGPRNRLLLPEGFGGPVFEYIRSA
jgi:8-oxo-dGTP pyrophosphatase MutT (NUDIX family)